MRTPVVVGAVVLVLAAGACSGGPGGESDEGVSVVATTTVLGDVAGRVVDCGGGEVRTLMPTGADPHDYAPSSTDIRDMVGADLVVANGLGLEEGLASAIETAQADGARVIEVAELVDPIPLVAEPDDEHGDDGHEAGSLDPHVWLDVTRMAEAADLVGGELAEVTGQDVYASCGTEVAEDLRATDAELRDILADVPSERRVLITDHRAFGYFAEAYDFEVAGVVVPGGSTLGDPSSEHLADLVDVVEESGVTAIFGDIAQNSELLRTLAEETGQDIETVPLYVGSLGPEGSGAEDYASMMLENAHLIADALGPQAEDGS